MPAVHPVRLQRVSPSAWTHPTMSGGLERQSVEVQHEVFRMHAPLHGLESLAQTNGCTHCPPLQVRVPCAIGQSAFVQQAVDGTHCEPHILYALHAGLHVTVPTQWPAPSQ
jgi:hypothetical protein